MGREREKPLFFLRRLFIRWEEEEGREMDWGFEAGEEEEGGEEEGEEKKAKAYLQSLIEFHHLYW